MPWIAPVIGGLATLGGAAIGAGAQAGANAQSREMIQKAVDYYNNLGVPPAESMKVIMEDLKNAGMLTPELEQTVSQMDTEMKGISTDPRSKEAQFKALSELEDLGMGGMRLSDQAALEGALGEAATKERGAREAINASLRGRGAYGSGAELAAKLAATQDAATTGHKAAVDTAAHASDRALQAIIQAGEMGGDIRNTDFNEQRAIAQAQDEINRFNAANKAETIRRNTDRTNAAQEYNVKNAQRISDENVGNRNANAVRNSDLLQREYENQLQKASGVANAYTGQANQVAKEGAAQAATWGKVGQGVGQIATSIGKSTNGTPTTTTTAAPYSGTDRRYTNPDEEERYTA